MTEPRDKTRIKEVIASAIESYARSELTSLSYHDPAMRETAYDAMHKLIEESRKIAGYALVNITDPVLPKITNTEKFSLIEEWMKPELWSVLDGRRLAILKILAGERVEPPSA